MQMGLEPPGQHDTRAPTHVLLLSNSFRDTLEGGSSVRNDTAEVRKGMMQLSHPRRFQVVLHSQWQGSISIVSSDWLDKILRGEPESQRAVAGRTLAKPSAREGRGGRRRTFCVHLS